MLEAAHLSLALFFLLVEELSGAVGETQMDLAKVPLEPVCPVVCTGMSPYQRYWKYVPVKLEISSILSLPCNCLKLE